MCVGGGSLPPSDATLSSEHVFGIIKPVFSQRKEKWRQIRGMNESSAEISEVMNLVGYGMAKFNYDFIHEFGVKSKQDFARYFISLGFAKTIRSVLNRQDSFDPYFDNGRRGWFQRPSLWPSRDRIGSL